MARTQVALEAFTFSDSTTLETVGLSRIFDNGDGGGYVGVKSNRVDLLFSNSARHVYRVAGTYTDDQYAKITVVALADNVNRQVGVVVRASADTGANRDYYEWWVAGAITGGTRSFTLARVSNGTVTTLDTRSIALTAGDTIEMEVSGTGTSTLLECFKNGVSQFTYTDSSGSALSTGKPGLSIRGSSSGSDTTLDDLDTGNVTSGTVQNLAGTAAGQGSATGNLSVSAATITTPPLKNRAGTVQASTTIPKLTWIRLSDFAQMTTWTNQATNGSGVLTLTGAGVVAGVPGLLVISNADGSARGVHLLTPA